MDCLDPAVAVSVQFTTKAFADLPIVTEQDYLTGIEKYRTLIGKVFREGRGFRVVVHHVYDFDCYYQAGPYEIRQSFSDELGIRNAVKLFSRVLNKYRGMELVGEIHTHPILSGQCVPAFSCAPSAPDLQGLINSYCSGLISPLTPYLYGIGGLMDNAQTGYNFYHLRNNGREMFSKVDWLPDIPHP